MFIDSFKSDHVLLSAVSFLFKEKSLLTNGARAPTHEPKNCDLKFLSLLPAIRRYIRYAFRNVPPTLREEAIAEAVAAAYVAYRRLVDRGQTSRAFATPLARFSIGRVRDNRHVGGRRNRNNVSCPFAARQHGFRLAGLERYDANRGRWLVRAIPASDTPIPDQVAFRIDFADWLSRLPGRNRRIAETLACGNTTSEVAHRFRVSAARISQLRLQFFESWHAYTGEAPDRRMAKAA
jgi:hypothetical protein